jgi:hypothetical protein
MKLIGRRADTVLCLTPCHEGVLGEQIYSSTHSLISALDGGEWSASAPPALPPGKEPLVPRAILDAVVKSSQSPPGIEP